MFRHERKNCKPPRFVLGHDCYPVTSEHPGPESTITLINENGFDTDEAEKRAKDLLAKGTRRALKHLNFAGNIHLDEAACCTVNPKLVVSDPKTPRDDVHAAYDPHDEGDKSPNTHNERAKVGNFDPFSTPILLLKTIPLGVGAVAEVVSFNNAVSPKGCTKH